MITKPDNEPEEEEIEEISDAALYRHLIVNHVGLRDHYAAAALTGLLSDHVSIGIAKDAATEMNMTAAEFMAHSAYEFADVMIAHRGRK